MTTHTPSWPTPPPPDADQLRALAAYEALPTHERQRAARLVQHTGCSLALAVAAIAATRPERTARPG
jgi:hypothetical protein